MKIRKGFVSNSSSSSFVCDVCGRQESGWDMILSEAEFYQCEHGHIFCYDEVVKDVPEYILEDDVMDGGLPEEYCPICTLSIYIPSIMVKYYKKLYGDDYKEAFKELKKVNKRRRKLYDNEYVTFVSNKYDTNPEKDFKHIKEQYGTYSKLLEYINGQ